MSTKDFSPVMSKGLVVFGTGDISIICQHLWKVLSLSLSLSFYEVDIPPLPSCHLFSFHDKPDFFQMNDHEVVLLVRIIERK